MSQGSAETTGQEPTLVDHGQDNSPRALISIIGAGGHAVSVANVALSAGFRVASFIDQKKAGAMLLGIPVIADFAELEEPDACSFAVAVGDNAGRERAYGEFATRHTNARFPTLVHATATISHFSTVADGTVVMPRAVVGPNSRVGRFCLINTLSAIDHDCEMSDFASLAPGAITGGAVIIGRRSAVSIGAVVKHGVRIGDDCVVGANSYLNQDLPSNLLAYGSPARQIRSRAAGDPYLK